MHGAPAPEEYHKQFGFEEVHTLDVSPYEGASHIHDLNDENIPADLIGQYRAVSSGGTLEHIFRIDNAIKTALRLLEVGGSFLCDVPVNNFIDHGFYQISPTLLFDYFAENGLEFGTSAAVLTSRDAQKRRGVPLYPGEANALNYTETRVAMQIVVTKMASSTVDRVPLQSVYQRKHGEGGGARPWRFRPFEPYDLEADCIRAAPIRRFDLDRRKMKRTGRRIEIPFHRKEHLASLPGRPFRSKALVYEDGSLLTWIVSDPGLVADRPGSFCHFAGALYFSTRDGSDPRENGRHYEVGFPATAVGLEPYPIDWPSR